MSGDVGVEVGVPVKNDDVQTPEDCNGAGDGAADSVADSAADGVAADVTADVARKVLLDAERIRRSLIRMAHEIAEHTPDVSELALVGIQRRGVELAARLSAMLGEHHGAAPITGTIDIAFYRDDLDTRAPAYDQPLVRSTSLPFDVQGRRIVLVDDVLFTGRTIRAAIEALFDYGRPAVVQLAVLVDRGHRELPIRPDYVGKNVPTSRHERIEVRLVECDGVDEVLLEAAPAS